MSEYQVQIVDPVDLSADDIASWRQMRRDNPALYSPYFHFNYTEILGRLHQDVHVLIVRDGAKPLAFLPFQGALKPNGKVGFARPIGAPMTDYHGMICAVGTQMDMVAVLRQAGFGAFHFSTLVDHNNLLQSHIRSTTDCTMMDVSGGAQAWREANTSSYRRHLKSTRRRIRKSEELGARRFEFKSRDADVYDTLIRWKREKFSQSGKFDVLSADWTRSLLQELWMAGEDAPLRADMHVLYFGDEIAAIDLGITDGPTFHSWIVAYNADLHQLAPGIQLLEALIDEADAQNYARIDLGEGLDGYKRHYASNPVTVSSGFIAASGPAAALSNMYGAAENFGEKNLGGVGKIPGMVRRRYSQIQACEPDMGARAQAMLEAVKANRS